MKSDSPIFVAGHRGLVGAALVRRLRAQSFENLIVRDHATLDLTDGAAVDRFFDTARPEYVFLAAAKVGGIHANDSLPADFIRINLQIQTHVIDAAYRHGVKKLLFLGSACIYPKHAPPPVREDALLTGTLEPTNKAYAVAKIAGMTMCEAYHRQYGANFIAAMPTNLYGPGDNFDLSTSHVLPALIRRFHEAKVSGVDRVTLWGTGTPRREFLYVDDLADACVFLMREFDAGPSRTFVNVGVGKDIAISELAGLVREVVGYGGDIGWDASMPDGTPRRLLDVGALADLGWRATTGLEEGIRRTYQWYLEHEEAIP